MIESVLLGVVQGLTEFLPVSSSAHLIFFQSFLGWEEPDLWYDILLHAATLAAVLVYFRKDIVKMFTSNRKLILLVAAGSVPTALIGYFGKDMAESAFTSVGWAAFFLIVTGTVLFAASKREDEGKGLLTIGYNDALLIGIVQGIAILPGISRSGSTIAAAIFLGIGRGAAAKFSFLLSIPAITGALLLGIKDYSSVSGASLGTAAAGMTAAFVSGLFAIYFLIEMLSKRKLSVFYVYCWAAGLILLAANFFIK